MRAAMVACKSGGHGDLGHVRAAAVGATVTVEHATFGQLAHDLLGEKRVPGGPSGDQLP